MFLGFGSSGLEPFNPASPVDELLLPGEKWVASRTDLNFCLLACRANLVDFPAGTDNFRLWVVWGMNVFLHFALGIIGNHRLNIKGFVENLRDRVERPNL
jgi:hypothetical protein